MIINGLEVNSPEYWEIRHQRDDWPRQSGWVLPTIVKCVPQDARVLEIGCGQGAFAAELKKMRPDLIVKGIDISPTAIEKANKNHGLGYQLRFDVADVFRLSQDLEDEEYNYIISIQNFEHWKLNTHKEALHQIWKRLMPGGRFFFTGVGEAWNLNGMNYSPMTVNGQTVNVPNDLHYNVWTEQSVYDLFQTQKATSVKFWRLRQKDRVVAEAEKNEG